MTRLALVGYGKMGRRMEQLAPEVGLQVTRIIDQGQEWDLRDVDVAIEFTMPEAAPRNLERLVDEGIPVVCGTTGWQSALPSIQQHVRERNGLLIWGSNFSIGVAVFRRLVAEAGRLLANEPSYGAYAWEVHHAAKKDAPSGTLHMLVDELRKAGYQLPVDVSASRAGAHPGTHELVWDSPEDTILLRHAARSRDGFAKGALRTALWAHQAWQGGKRGTFEFNETLGE